MAVTLEGPTAEERGRDSLERAAMIRSRTKADRQYRERAAVGLETAKRDKMCREEDGGGAVGTVRSSLGKVEEVFPGIYSVIQWDEGGGAGLAAVAQISNVRREVQMAADHEGARREVAMTAANQTAVVAAMAECRPAVLSGQCRAGNRRGSRGTLQADPTEMNGR